MKPTILESRFAHPRDELIYKIDSKVILLVTCPDLKEPYEELPWDYILQAQALLALCDDADDVHIYCWTEQGSSLFRTGRDYTLWTMASVAVAEFWEEHVEPGRKRYNINININMNPFLELADNVPSDRHHNFDVIHSYGKIRTGVFTDRLLYEVSPIYLILCGSSSEPNRLVDTYYRVEAPIATRFKRGDMDMSDTLYLGVTMYDHQNQKIPVYLDDTLFSYILHCETLSYL